MNIIITGCSQGIGNELVDTFFKDINHKVIGISRNADKLEQQQIKYGNERFKGIVYDLNTIFNKPEILIHQIENNLPHIDILINNAGFLVNGPFTDISYNDIETTFKTNLFAPAELIKVLMPLLIKSKHAHIINIGSMAGYQGSMKFPGLAWYSASKAALACLTESMAVELKNTKIAINCLALGSVQTEMLGIAFPGFKAPLTANEMAGFIANFALTGHKVFNGKVLPVALSNP
jgi:3-oxoacyl-[acyl-carrier protein] reductase